MPVLFTLDQLNKQQGEEPISDLNINNTSGILRIVGERVCISAHTKLELTYNIMVCVATLFGHQ